MSLAGYPLNRTKSLTLYPSGSVVTLMAMLVFYALEARSPVFVLLFAGACVGSSAYGFLQGAWPFGVVEAIWTSVALHRWRACVHRGDPAEPESRPIACNMSAFAPDERRRYDALRDSLPLPEIAEWVSLEHRCCPFLKIALIVQPDNAWWVELGGSRATREFLSKEFGSAIR